MTLRWHGQEIGAGIFVQVNAKAINWGARAAGSIGMGAVSGQLGIKATTPPTLPNKTIVNEGGVKIQHYSKSGDHSPAHAHVKGEGFEVKIGKSGQALPGQPSLSPKQSRVVKNNSSLIHSRINKIRKYIKHFK